MLPSQSKKIKSSKKMRRSEVLMAPPEIPLDLQMEIVNRLPVKSLVRFKCLSKFWYSLIRSKGYLFPSPTPRLFISLPQNHRNCMFRENVCRPARPVLLSLSSSTSKKDTSTAAFDLDVTYQGIGGGDMASLRGLILYTVCLSQPCIYNPTTGQRLTLPKLNLFYGKEGYAEHFFLGYDPVLDQYKVVCTMAIFSKNHPVSGMHWVFVLEAGGYWKKIEFNHPHVCTAEASPLCINGVIYYLSVCFDLRTDNIISFNVFFEEFDIIHLPPAVAEYPVSDALGLGLIDYGGKPCLFDSKHLRSSGLVNLWVLEDDAETWSRISLVLQSCQLHLVPDNTFLKVIGTTQNGEVVLQPGKMSYPYYILYYDLNKNDLRRVDIRGISVHELRKVDKGISYRELTPCTLVSSLALMDTVENIMHLEI